MKFGRFEVDWFAILVIGFVTLWIIMTISADKVRIEEEKTKQMQIQQSINNVEEVNNG